MTSSSRRAVVLALVLSVPSVGTAGPARAQAHSPTAQELETARSLYKEGKELRARGDLRGALEKLRAAHALGNTPVTGIELARTQVQVGQIVEARELCLYIARMPVADDETEKSREARADAAKLGEELRPRIPTLRVKVEGLPAGEVAHLFIDGGAVPDAALGEPQKVDPGKHTVAIRVGEGAAARGADGEGVVAEGQAGEVTLTVPPRPVVAPPVLAVEPPPEPPTRTGPLLVKLGFGAAVAGGAVGLLAGITALNKKGQLATECNAAKQCDDSTGGSSDLATARTWATVSTVAFVVGGAGVVLGVIGLVTGKGAGDKRDQAMISPWIGAGAAGLDGRF
jgi:hypothetical protein